MTSILTLNAGSSSIKYALFDRTGTKRLEHGLVERIGAQARLVDDDGAVPLGSIDHNTAVEAILDHLGDRDIQTVGHRIVHGGPNHRQATAVTDMLIAEMHGLVSLAPLHQPHNLHAIEAVRARFPAARQIACFDTAFHRTQPFVSDTYALPRRFYGEGIRRYGFHGLSFEHIASRMADIAPNLHAGRVIAAHLGNGVSICSMLGGRSIGSTMGFTALDGVPMGTRCGQIDPGVLLYLLDQGVTKDDLTRLLYEESGLLGLSGLSNDMRDLLASTMPEAQEAIDYYTFRIRHEIGARAADLGGIDALVFCGGIGENAPEIRARVVDPMGWLGLSLDPKANEKGSVDIGTGPVPVMVIPTDEEAVIARQSAEIVNS